MARWSLHREQPTRATATRRIDQSRPAADTLAPLRGYTKRTTRSHDRRVPTWPTGNYRNRCQQFNSGVEVLCTLLSRKLLELRNSRLEVFPTLLWVRTRVFPSNVMCYKYFDTIYIHDWGIPLEIQILGHLSRATVEEVVHADLN